MGGVPEAAEARRALLARWAEEQRRRLRAERPISERLARVPGNIMRALTRPDSLLEGDLANRLLDRGLNTSEWTVEPEHAEAERVRYGPSSWHVLPRALSYLGVSDYDTFVDFGCGKGRVVHQAAKRPFRRVIGVEISPLLAEIARDGLASRSREHRCGDVKVVVCDASKYRVPDDLTIGYFFNPFYGETLDTVLRNIVGSIDRRPRRVRLIYVDPVFGGQILATGRFRLEKWLRGGLRDRRLSRAAIFESC